MAEGRQIVDLNNEAAEPIFPGRAGAAIAALQNIVHTLNDAGVHIRQPVDLANVRLALGPAIEGGLYPNGEEHWRGVWGGNVPDNQQLDIDFLATQTDPDAGPGPDVLGPQEGATLIPDRGDLLSRQEAAIREMNRINPSPADFSARPGGLGLNVLGNREVRISDRRLRMVAFAGMSNEVATVLWRPLLRGMALRFAHTGTSPKMVKEGYTVTISVRNSDRHVNIGPWVEWMCQGGDNSRGVDSWLRKYARGVLAIDAYQALKRDPTPTPFVAKYGVNRQARAIAFDFSDGIPDHMLTPMEHRNRPKMRRAALEQTDEDVDAF